jgi:hypothetical protein
MMIRLTCGALLNGRTVIGWNIGRHADVRLLPLVLSVRSVPLVQTTWPIARLNRNNSLSVYQ